MVIVAALLVLVGVALFFLRHKLASGKVVSNVVVTFSAIIFVAGVALAIYHAAVM